MINLAQIEQGEEPMDLTRWTTGDHQASSSRIFETSRRSW